MSSADDFSRPIGDAIAELAGLHRKDTPEQFQLRVRAAFRYAITKTEAERFLAKQEG